MSALRNSLRIHNVKLSGSIFLVVAENDAVEDGQPGTNGIRTNAPADTAPHCFPDEILLKKGEDVQPDVADGSVKVFHQQARTGEPIAILLGDGRLKIDFQDINPAVAELVQFNPESGKKGIIRSKLPQML